MPFCKKIYYIKELIDYFKNKNMHINSQIKEEKYIRYNIRNQIFCLQYYNFIDKQR